MLRHEQQTVRMALAAALHHSAGPRDKVEMQQNGAPRGQKTAARAGEEVEHASHYGPRAQETPPPGVRPDSLAEPGPQMSDRSLRRSSGQTPLLGVPSLADAPAEAIDGSTLRYLLKANIARKKFEEEEEEEEKKYQERAAETRRRAQALLDHAASLPKRKRKKKRKKKLPRSGYKFLPRSRRLFGTNSTLLLREGRPWLLRSILAASCPYGSLQARDARHYGQYGPEGLVCWFFTMFLVLCSLLCLQAQDARLHGRHGPQDSWSLTGAVLGQGFLHARCCATCGVLVQTVQYWRFRSCSSSRSSALPVDTQRQIPMVLAAQMTISIPQLQLIDNAADVLVVHVGQVPQVQVVFLTFFSQFLVQVVEKTVEFPVAT